MMLKKPSPVAELERRLEDRPVEAGRADERLGLGLRARVVEVGSSSTPIAPMWTSRRTPAAVMAATTARVPFGVDQAQVRAAVEVARDRHEVDDGVDAGQRRPERVRAGDVADARLDARRGAAGSRREDRLAVGRRPDQRDDPMIRRPAAPGTCGCRRSRSRRSRGRWTWS